MQSDDRSAKFGRWTWNLRYSHSALRRIQMVTASLSTFSEQLLEGHRHGNLTAGLDPQKAAVMIWAGQAWIEPKLTPEKVTRRLGEMTDVERGLLSTWAAADFLTACMKILDAKLAAQIATGEDDDE